MLPNGSGCKQRYYWGKVFSKLDWYDTVVKACNGLGINW
jgi:hypothetical protein